MSDPWGRPGGPSRRAVSAGRTLADTPARSPPRPVLRAGRRRAAPSQSPPRVHTQCGPLARGGDSPGKGWGASCVSGFPHAGCQSCSSRNSRLVSSPAPSFNTARTRCPRNQIRNRCNPSAVPSSSLTGRRPGSFPFCMNALNRNVRESREGLRSDAHGKN